MRSKRMRSKFRSITGSNVRIAAPVFNVTTRACVPGASARMPFALRATVKAKPNHLDSQLATPPDLSPGQRELLATSS